MSNIFFVISGFICGVIVLTYIHVVIIQRKLNKLLKGIDKAFDEAESDIRGINENDICKQERIERLRICQVVFSVLNRAIHLS